MTFLKNKWPNPGLFTVHFRPFLIPITISTIQMEKSIDDVPGIQTWVRRMVGADETTEPCLHLVTFALKIFIGCT